MANVSLPNEVRIGRLERMKTKRDHEQAHNLAVGPLVDSPKLHSFEGMLGVGQECQTTLGSNRRSDCCTA